MCNTVPYGVHIRQMVVQGSATPHQRQFELLTLLRCLVEAPQRASILFLGPVPLFLILLSSSSCLPSSSCCLFLPPSSSSLIFLPHLPASLPHLAELSIDRLCHLVIQHLDPSLCNKTQPKNKTRSRGSARALSLGSGGQRPLASIPTSISVAPSSHQWVEGIRFEGIGCRAPIAACSHRCLVSAIQGIGPLVGLPRVKAVGSLEDLRSNVAIGCAKRMDVRSNVSMIRATVLHPLRTSYVLHPLRTSYVSRYRLAP